MSNKIALVTGGSRGLGKNMALRLADKGIHVVLTYHSKQHEAEQVVKDIEAKGVKALALQLDTSVVAGFDVFIERLTDGLQAVWGVSTFDFLVNNAGIGARAPISETTEADFDALMNVHVKGVFFLTQKAIPMLNTGGRIINISTGLARFCTPGYAAYASMKGAIEVFTRYLAKELGPKGIAANVVAPGAIDTDFTRPGYTANPGIVDHIASQTALGRLGQPEDIGGVVAFLCTNDARWINAQRIEVSGGMFI